MKKKYQIPESGSKFLRTNLICGSGSIPGGNGESVDEPIENQEPGSDGDADARRRSNLLNV